MNAATQNNNKWKTDWLGTEPVFYNTLTKRVSHNPHEVIDFDSFEWNPKGLHAYLRCGYCALGLTPVNNVHFASANKEVSLSEDNVLQVRNVPDPAIKWLDKTSNENTLLSYLEQIVHRWEDNQKGDILVPTSGGYDSRLLNFLIKDKKRIRAFTYGLSVDQSESYESVYAKAICEKMKIQWQRIELGNYHDYLDGWDDIFGYSTHAHGMYHMEFYHKIRKIAPSASAFLSGIIGDGFSGKVRVSPLRQPEDVEQLFLSYGMTADANMSILPCETTYFEEYLESKKQLLENESYRILELLRNKLMLLRYLMLVPKTFGFSPWSPFLDINVAMGMLQLPSDRRQDRAWQKELFKHHGLDVENSGLQTDRDNSLNIQALFRKLPPPLDADLLKEIVRPDYVEWCNSILAALKNNLPSLTRQRVLSAYFAYLTLRPLEKLIRRRDAYLSGNSDAEPQR